MNTEHEGKNEGIIDWGEEEIGMRMNRRQSRRRQTKSANVRPFFWLKEGGPMASDFSSIDSQSVMASGIRLRPKKRKGKEEATRVKEATGATPSPSLLLTTATTEPLFYFRFPFPCPNKPSTGGALHGIGNC
ncbi:unnamed protein product [Lactuca saligna]|uniref:Uncharacterized protein n=1 Tax=Lactuca saligna TaxID=75948 RepID=A0AA35VWI4_LACSI|nr:unnamed protein product [Lactuca saligna]